MFGKLLVGLGNKVGMGWAYAIVYGVIAAIVLAAAMSAYNWAYDNGFTKAQAAALETDNEELRTANALIDQLQREARASEADHAKVLTDISTGYENEIIKSDKEKNVVITNLRNGVIVLRDQYAAAKNACKSGVSETSSGPGEYNGETGTDLSQRSSEFLYEQADKADKIVDQLTACQAVVLEDRVRCGANAK